MRFCYNSAKTDLRDNVDETAIFKTFVKKTILSSGVFLSRAETLDMRQYKYNIYEVFKHFLIGTNDLITVGVPHYHGFIYHMTTCVHLNRHVHDDHEIIT